MAKIIELEQNSPAWLEWRRGGIGGSDSNLIAFHFLPDDVDWPFSNSWSLPEVYRLWAEKVGRIPLKPKQDKSFGDYVDPLTHGKKTEQEARDFYNASYGEVCEPICLEHETVPHLRASLDGWPSPDPVTGLRPILEIKCPKEPEMHRKAKEGEVPKYYSAQLLHNMAVCGARVAHFVSYYKGEGVMVPIESDSESLDKLREAEEIFWGWVTSGDFGGMPIQGEVTRHDEEWATLVDQYFENQEQIRKLEAKERRLKRELFARCKATTTIGAGARVSLTIRPATVVPSFKKNEFLTMSVQRS